MIFLSIVSFLGCSQTDTIESCEIIWETREEETGALLAFMEAYGELIQFPAEEHMDYRFERYAEVSFVRNQQDHDEAEPSTIVSEYNTIVAFNENTKEIFTKSLDPENIRGYVKADGCDYMEENREGAKIRERYLLRGGFTETCSHRYQSADDGLMKTWFVSQRITW